MASPGLLCPGGIDEPSRPNNMRELLTLWDHWDNHANERWLRKGGPPVLDGGDYFAPSRGADEDERRAARRMKRHYQTRFQAFRAESQLAGEVMMRKVRRDEAARGCRGHVGRELDPPLRRGGSLRAEGDVHRGASVVHRSEVSYSN